MRLHRRRDRRVTSLVAGAALAVALAGCGLEPNEPATTLPAGGPAMTEAEYVDVMAAVNLALEEGLAGEEALERARALGAPEFTRAEIEEFVEHLRGSPMEWARVERRVHEKIALLRDSSAKSP